MKYLTMLERPEEGEPVRAEDGGWLEELEVVHNVGLGVVHQKVWRQWWRMRLVQEALGIQTNGTSR